MGGENSREIVQENDRSRQIVVARFKESKRRVWIVIQESQVPNNLHERNQKINLISTFTDFHSLFKRTEKWAKFDVRWN